jgi:hypothetical protein
MALAIFPAAPLASGQGQSSATTRSPHGSLSIPCQNCHTISGWKPIRAVPEFDHNTTKYPLRGMHEGVSCVQCHTKPIFTNVGKQCADCHADIHKRQMGANCEQCHTVKGWNVSVQQINQHLNRFPLIGAHAALDCDQCHTGAAVGQFQGLSTACYSCHQKDFVSTKSVGIDHVALGLPVTCEQCHSMDNWMGAKFDHLKFTGFALTGAHATLDCAACHAGGKFNNAAATCDGCHMADFNKTNNPPHAQAGFPTTCQTCHSTTAWDPTTFDHSTFTKFPLTGAHVSVACTQCHINGQFVGTPTDCASCHMKDFNGTTTPNHVQSGFPTTCQQCHTTTTWNSASFDHSTTGFTLTGAHVALQCTQCHNTTFSPSGAYSLTSTTCITCHQTDFNNASNPNHVQSGFSQNCTQCHNTTTWTGAAFDHSTTGFTLTGAHVALQCTQCHNTTFSPSGAYNLSNSTTCITCHQTDFNGATNPNHVQSGFSQNCTQCHNTTSWTGAAFDHSTTGFTLDGAHASLQCTQCHNTTFSPSGAYNLPNPTACVTCHQTDFNGTTSPNHVQAGFPTVCQQCHTTTNWTGATFNHASTGFTLDGAHTALQCQQCHNTSFSPSGAYNLPNPTACVTCHQTDFNGTTNPNHVQSGFPTVCQQCHNTTNWTSGTFNHSTTGFTLDGAHVALQCAQCHNTTFSPGGAYNLPNPTGCVTCHQTDFNGTTSPNHVQAGFPTTCQQCHTTTNWNGATFNHASTGFTLDGAHTALQCTQCHNTTFSPSGAYNLPNPTGCVQCHQTDFNGATNPNHVQAGFPTTCQQCHTTTAWTGATFNHTSTGFTLDGAHVALQCAQCHNTTFSPSGAYNLPNPTGCVQCHQTDFNGATNPNHVQAGFPTTCQQCHSTTNWTSATFNHTSTGFTLDGAHASLQCAQCHNTTFSPSGAYNLPTPTACVTCHQTDFNGTTSPSHTQANFPTTCQQCHTTTSWGGATFNHSTTGFTLDGAHTALQCTQCHNTTFSPSGAYSLPTPTACVQCHQTDYNGTNNPSHVQAGFPTTCQTCHSTTNWTSATFNHASTGFTLTGAHVSLQCAQCHNTTFSPSGAYNLPNPTACVQCHRTDFNGTTNPNHVQSGFPTACDQCHTTTNWLGATFNHASTGFTLQGPHATLQCTQCHNTTFSPSGPYSLTSTACITCHQADYTGTNNPPHATVGFPTTCDACHTTWTTTNWAGATFNHNTTTFPLTGYHATNVTCAQCHVNNNYTTLPTACYGCHATDYNGTTNPNHQSAGFPTTCDTCHTTTAWTGATFNHTYFPTNHGNANGVCATCHTNSSDYSVFQCTGCHGNNNAANFQHPNVGGYVYNSTNCYQCHKNAGGG